MQNAVVVGIAVVPVSGGIVDNMSEGGILLIMQTITIETQRVPT